MGQPKVRQILERWDWKLQDGLVSWSVCPHVGASLLAVEWLLCAVSGGALSSCCGLRFNFVKVLAVGGVACGLPSQAAAWDGRRAVL